MKVNELGLKAVFMEAVIPCNPCPLTEHTFGLYDLAVFLSRPLIFIAPTPLHV